jgi:hypothetical protein
MKRTWFSALMVMLAATLSAAPLQAGDGDGAPTDVPSRWLLDANWGVGTLFPNPLVSGGRDQIYAMPAVGAELRHQFATYQQLGIRTDWMSMDNAPDEGGAYRKVRVAAVYGGVLPVDRLRLTADLGLGWSWTRNRQSIDVISVGSGLAVFGSIGATWKLHRYVGLGVDAVGTMLGNPTLQAYGSLELGFGASSASD